MKPHWFPCLIAALTAACAGPRATAPRAAVEFPRIESPPAPSGLLANVVEVSAGLLHTCALRTDRSVWCWGDNRVGQLGDGTRVSRATPVRVDGLPAIRAIAAGANTTCALGIDGDSYCWGGGSFGQLGDGERANGTALPVRTRNVPTSIGLFASNATARNCALAEDGRVVCWGRLALGPSGRGRPAPFANPTPQALRSSGDVVSVAIGALEECVLGPDGSVACRGFDGTREVTDFTPVRGIEDATAIAVGERHACALVRDGQVQCWRVAESGASDEDVAAARTPIAVALPGRARAISAGHAHTCAILEDGGVSCWGDNGARQLGAHEGVRSDEPVRIALQGAVERIAAGARHTCALLESGELVCWGDNLGGQLGDGTYAARAWPVAVLGGAAAGEPDVRDTQFAGTSDPL